MSIRWRWAFADAKPPWPQCSRPMLRITMLSRRPFPIPVDRPVAAKVMFDIDGVGQTLYATRQGDNYVLHFTDATSGHASYGSGRNVRIPADQSGDVSIDLNYATLLPCSFSRAWNCPIPPLENRLRVPIEAGERFAVDHDGVPLL